MTDYGVCEWFIGCENQADGYVIHPVLGTVPTCDRCANKLGLTFTDDNLWSDAWSIAYVGACNPRAVQRTLDQYTETYGADHTAVRAIKGHLDYLNGKSLGPDFSDLMAVMDRGEGAFNRVHSPR